MTGYNDFDLDQVLVFFNARFFVLLLSVAALVHEERKC